jgi:hypothetical protein
MRRKLIIVVCLLAVLLTAALLWPTAGYDISRVLPQLRELSAPYQSVSTGYYLDGGSVGITIIDRDARTLELALPVSADGDSRYPRLFIGASHASETNALEVAFTEDTRRMLIAIVEEHRSPTDDSDIALAALRGALRDYTRLGGRAAANFCESLVR